MKRVLALLLAVGCLLSAPTASHAIDFKARGQWLMGFTAGKGGLLHKVRENKVKRHAKSSDSFEASQRFRLQIDATASRRLSGTLYFEMGDATWGKAGHGSALGADDKIIELKRAYIDWLAPELPIRVRMGIQGFTLPNAAGGSSILDDDVAGVIISTPLNQHMGIGLIWARPWNDNYTKGDWTKVLGAKGAGISNDSTGYLDNVDLFAVHLPMRFDGIRVTPWIVYGVAGPNSATGAMSDWRAFSYLNSGYMDGIQATGTFGRWKSVVTDRTSQSSVFALCTGIPIKLTLWDPWNVELDINYASIGSFARGTIYRSDGVTKRFDTKAQGWLVKALIEYKFDWGTPGIFGWYASGDDDNPKNGSERMPALSPNGRFTSFFGDGNLGWSTSDQFYDRSLNYAGTWGIGLELSNISFIENIKHTLRAVYRGGTNSPSMAKYATGPWSWSNARDYQGESVSGNKEIYLTTNDAILEFNLVNDFKIYDNFSINVELGYIVNFIDHDTWKKSHAGRQGASFEKQDAWKAQLIFAYTF